jgi:hypothetical protein
MKKNSITIKGAILFFVLILSTSCSDNFLDRPSEDTFDASNFYSSDEQVKSSTSAMYGKIWAPFFTKSFYALSEVSSGNVWAAGDGDELMRFQPTAESSLLYHTWGACFGVVAQSNNLINTLETSVGPNVSKSVVESTVAEAHFMRAIAYLYIVRLWGEVPIIENNLDYVQNPNINTNRVQDVYTLIIRDFQYAADHLPARTRKRDQASYSQNIRLSSGSAKAFLAKAYLYTKDYAKARALAKEVIDSGEFDLMANFGDLYRIPNNNNQESIYSWQWKVTGGYQDGNLTNIQYGPDVLNEVNYGAVYIPSKDIINAFEIGDNRRKATIMREGDYYPELVHDGGVGFTVSAANGFLDATGALVKKYVVGKISAETGNQDEYGGTNACNYIMRYAELLLIHAEAVMAGNSETTDAQALASFNKVRERAGLPAKTKITHEDMIHERRIELAFEGEYWYDLGRLPASEAISIMSQQDRSAYSTTPVYFTPTAANLIYPKPSNDVNKNPKLNEPAVPYVFK